MLRAMLFRALPAVLACLLAMVHVTTGEQTRRPSEGAGNRASIITYRVIHSYPHDSAAFTQGLAFHEGSIYEGTGIRGRSELRRVNLSTGKVVQRHALPDNLFGVGIALWGDSVIQLTYRSKTGLIYDRHTFSLMGSFHYEGEGWGITHDGRRLIMSNGTPVLSFLDPRTCEVTGSVQVRDDDLPVTNLNELEYRNGRVYANVWRTDRIAIIDPETASVTAWLDLTMLAGQAGGTGS
jgi:glutamine cyclotransferase